jgi:hypothetical protein
MSPRKLATNKYEHFNPSCRVLLVANKTTLCQPPRVHANKLFLNISAFPKGKDLQTKCAQHDCNAVKIQDTDRVTSSWKHVEDADIKRKSPISQNKEETKLLQKLTRNEHWNCETVKLQKLGYKIYTRAWLTSAAKPQSGHTAWLNLYSCWVAIQIQ